MRDMRDALGALGPVDGQNPELNNLTCSLTYCDPGDIVFLTSDGISDNFDPVVGKFAIPKKEKESKTRESQSTERPSTAKEGRDVQNGSQEPQNTGNKSQNPAREPQSSRRNGERVNLQGRQMPSNQQRSRSRRTQQGSKGPNVGPGRGGKQVIFHTHLHAHTGVHTHAHAHTLLLTLTFTLVLYPSTSINNEINIRLVKNSSSLLTHDLPFSL